MSRANPRFHRNNPNLLGVGTATVVEIAMQGLLEQQQCINTFYYVTNAAGVTFANVGAMLASFRTGIEAKYLACVSADYTLQQYKATVVSPSTIAPNYIAVAPAAPGTRPAGHLPTQMAILISRYSGFTGQHGRGRVYLPGVAASDVVNSTVTNAALLTALDNLKTQMLVPVNDGTNNWDPCIAQRSKTTPKQVLWFADVIQATPRTLLATIRRRRIGRGK